MYRFFFLLKLYTLEVLVKHPVKECKRISYFKPLLSYVQPFQLMSSHIKPFHNCTAIYSHLGPFAAIPAIYSNLQQLSPIYSHSSHLQSCTAIFSQSSYFRPFIAIFFHFSHHPPFQPFLGISSQFWQFTAVLVIFSPL